MNRCAVHWLLLKLSYQGTRQRWVPSAVIKMGRSLKKQVKIELEKSRANWHGTCKRTRQNGDSGRSVQEWHQGGTCSFKLRPASSHVRVPLTEEAVRGIKKEQKSSKTQVSLHSKCGKTTRRTNIWHLKNESAWGILSIYVRCASP